nr:MAG TPA: hypothetical protein [Caudoviricetes sp.]
MVISVNDLRLSILYLISSRLGLLFGWPNC